MKSRSKSAEITFPEKKSYGPTSYRVLQMPITALSCSESTNKCPQGLCCRCKIVSSCGSCDEPIIKCKCSSACPCKPKSCCSSESTPPCCCEKPQICKCKFCPCGRKPKPCCKKMKMCCGETKCCQSKMCPCESFDLLVQDDCIKKYTCRLKCRTNNNRKIYQVVCNECLESSDESDDCCEEESESESDNCCDLCCAG